MPTANPANPNDAQTPYISLRLPSSPLLAIVAETPCYTGPATMARINEKPPYNAAPPNSKDNMPANCVSTMSSVSSCVSSISFHRPARKSPAQPTRPLTSADVSSVLELLSTMDAHVVEEVRRVRGYVEEAQTAIRRRQIQEQARRTRRAAP